MLYLIKEIYKMYQKKKKKTIIYSKYIQIISFYDYVCVSKLSHERSSIYKQL